jgi:hypothetical protein
VMSVIITVVMIMLLRDLGPYGVIFFCVFFASDFSSFLSGNLLVDIDYYMQTNCLGTHHFVRLRHFLSSSGLTCNTYRCYCLLTVALTAR